MSQPEFRALGDVAEQVVVGYVGPSSAHFRSTGVPFLRTGNVGTRELDLQGLNFVTESFHKSQRKSQLRTGDVVITRVVSTEINCAIVPSELDGANCGNIIVVRPGSSLDSSFLAHLLCSKKSQAILMSRQVGSAQSVVNTSVLKSWEIPVPPIKEQRRIAAILDQADALRAKRREALAQLDSLTQSIFIEIFGDPIVNPMKWPMRAFGQICETRLGKMLDQKQQTGEHSRPYLRNANVQWHRFDLSDVSKMDFDESARDVFRLHPGDLLICEGGEPGRAAIWNGEISECYYQKALHRARPNGSIAIAAYLAWLLWFLSKGGGLGDHVTAATIAHLTGEKLKAMSVMIPPLALQQTFATRIQAVESLKTTHRTALTELDALFASLQHRAFAGAL